MGTKGHFRQQREQMAEVRQIVIHVRHDVTNSNEYVAEELKNMATVLEKAVGKGLTRKGNVIREIVPKEGIERIGGSVENLHRELRRLAGLLTRDQVATMHKQKPISARIAACVRTCMGIRTDQLGLLERAPRLLGLIYDRIRKADPETRATLRADAKDVWDEEADKYQSLMDMLAESACGLRAGMVEAENGDR